MKKFVLTAMSVLLVCSIFTAGCTSQNKNDSKKETKNTTSDNSESQKKISISDYNLEDYVELGDYQNVTVEVKNTSVSEQDVTDYANKVASQYPDYQKTDKTQVESGDVVDIDYVGTIDGEEFDGGSAKNYKLTIGSKQFIDGFEDGLIGKNVGETVDLNLTFPESFDSKDLAGKDVVFKVTINGIMKEIIYTKDQFTDKYVKDNFGFDTVGEFLKDVKDSLAEDNEKDKETNKRAALVDAVIKVCKVELPQELLEYKISNYKEQFIKMLTDKGYTLDQYLSQSGNQDQKQWAKDVASNMQKSLEQEMVFSMIAQEENLTIDKEGYDKYVDQFVSYYSYKDEKALYADYPKEDLQRSYLCDQVVQKLLKTLKITYVEE